MSTVAIWPLPPPNEALVLGSAVSAMVMRRALVSEASGLGPGDAFLTGQVEGYGAYAVLGAEPVVVATPMTGPSGIYGVPTTGPERLVTPYDLGTLGVFDAAAMIPLADGGALAGHATAEGVTLRRVAPDGSLGGGHAFAPTTACGASGCSAPGMAELRDGRILVMTSTQGSSHEVWAWLVTADLSSILGVGMLGVGDGPFALPRADGSAWVGFATPFGVLLRPIRADASLTPIGPDVMVATAEADYSRTQVAQHGDAIAVTYSLASPPYSVVLNVVCD